MKKSSYSHRIPLSQFKLFNVTKALSRLDIELTERCNNNCIHCYINRPEYDAEARNNELQFEKIREILEEAVYLGCSNIRFTGGEPLLRDDFEDIYKYTRQLGLKVELFTNGSRITPHLAELFSRIPPGGNIQISLYGHNAPKYESISRTPGSYAAVQRGMDLLLARKVPFLVNPVILPMKLTTFREFDAWAEKSAAFSIPPAHVTTLHMRCRGDDDPRNSQIRALRISPRSQLEIEKSRMKNYISGLQQHCTHFCNIRGDSLFRCSAGIGRGSIDAYGNLQLCLMLRHPDTVYNLKAGSLADAVQFFFPQVRKLKARNSDYLERCGRCFLIDLCEQCPAVSWMENRVLDGWSEHFCNFTHAQAQLIGLLDEGEKAWTVTDWKTRINRLSGPRLQQEHIL